MTIRRRCTERSCKNGRRCLEHLRFDVMYRGKRYRMPVERVRHSADGAGQAAADPVDGGGARLGAAVHRRDQGRTRSAAAAEPPTQVEHATPTTSPAFLDAYLERCVKPAALRSISVGAAAASRVLKEHLGELPLDALEEPDEINRFKTDSDYAEEVEIATMHRVLETLRAAMNWGMAQTPPLFKKSPFHRFGVRMNKKAETIRDRRLSRDEEKRLLDTALQKMNTAEHQYVGPLLHDRIIGALELCCRRGEMLLIQNKRVNWETLPDRHPGRDGEGQGEPAHSVQSGGTARGDPRSAARRSGRTRSCSAATSGAYQPNIQTAWETLRLLAHGIEPKRGQEGRCNGTASSSSGSTSAGTTCGTKAPAGCWPTASTSASSS